ncbi:hypothetical protein ACWC5I_32385 [Kitasatospora sp. NPDC001574]
MSSSSRHRPAAHPHLWNGDADWARDSLVPQISRSLAGVAAAKGVQLTPAGCT